MVVSTDTKNSKLFAFLARNRRTILIVSLVSTALAILAWILLMSFAQSSDRDQNEFLDTSSVSSVHTNSSTDKLSFTHVLCRHGARNIANSIYPLDPWKDEKWWPEGFVQMTKPGIRKQYQLGQYLRKRYASLIRDDDYSAKKIVIQSTDKDRVIMSAAACLAGMFPPTHNKVWDEINWQPIPIHTIAIEDDYLLASTKQCDRLDFIISRYLNETNYKDIFKKHETLFKFLEINSGSKITTLMGMVQLHDTLSIEKMTGKQLPDWCDQIMDPQSDFMTLANSFMKIHTATDEMKKIMSGYLLKEILDRSASKVQSKLPQDLWFYSAHDATIVNMLNTLGPWEPYFLDFGACLFFDLYESKEDAYIDISFKPSPDAEATLIETSCGQHCSLSDFYKLYSNILPTKSFDEECALKDGEILLPNSNPESYTNFMKTHF